MANRGALIASAIFAAVCLASAGCAAKPLPPEVIRVEVPVPHCDPAPETPLPELPLARLSADATPEQVARAYLETVLILRREILIREALLDRYRQKVEKPKDSKELHMDKGQPTGYGAVQ